MHVLYSNLVRKLGSCFKTERLHITHSKVDGKKIPIKKLKYYVNESFDKVASISFLLIIAKLEKFLFSFLLIQGSRTTMIVIIF